MALIHFRVDAAVSTAAEAGDRAACVRASLQHQRREAFQVVAVLHQKEVHGQILIGTKRIEYLRIFHLL